MKRIFFISISIEISLLLSYSKDNDNILPPSDDIPWYWGYFRGEINGGTISMEV